MIKDDVFYKKQLKQLLKEKYRAFLENYEKTADLTGLGNSYVKSIIYNTIMETLLFCYARNMDKFLMDQSCFGDSDDDLQFGKQTT